MQSDDANELSLVNMSLVTLLKTNAKGTLCVSTTASLHPGLLRSKLVTELFTTDVQIQPNPQIQEPACIPIQAGCTKPPDMRPDSDMDLVHPPLLFTTNQGI